MHDIYQFVKYNSDTTKESIRKKCASGAVICFDLEDSIIDWIDESKGNALKLEYRKALHSIINRLNSENAPIKIGIRVNSLESGQQQLDLEAIPDGSKIHSILIPKVESSFHIDTLVNALAAKKIVYNELVPIIESRKGLEDLENILLSKYAITRVGFGHCDYNLSVGTFPFFQQDSNEYWKWANHIIGILKHRNIKFINSAYLNLGDSAFFQSMLSHLHYICDSNFGQFTLTHQQTLLCCAFTKPTNLYEGISRNRLYLGQNKAEIESLITSFEADNKGQGFTVNPKTKTLISPQEYCMSKRRLALWKENTMHFTFVGGCFPVQGDILYEDLFHQTLKRKVETNFNVNFDFNIIRYEKFGNCLEKIVMYNNQNPIDYLVFHIRPEPFLRLTKLYYKYLDVDFKLQHSLNFPMLRILNPEKYDLLRLSQRNDYSFSGKQSKLYKSLINLNYMAGYSIGNQNYALIKYLDLVNDVVEYCEKQGIKLIVLGPAKRSGTFMEAIFSGNLENFMYKHLKSNNINYMDGMVKNTENGVRYFNENGIHATKLYHDLIAKRIYEAIKGRT